MLLGILLTLQILVSTALIAVILLQRSEGGALGMGGGPSGFMTARGAGDLLTRVTAILAGVFFVLCLTMTIVAGHLRGSGSVVDRLKVDALNPDALLAKPAQNQTVPANSANPPPVNAAPGPAPVSPFEAPRPQVNTAPIPAAPAPATSTRDSGIRSPASQILGVQTAPQAPAPAAPAAPAPG
ncbi:MAG: preprotein translocase subunit SecG, partial [Caulobacteraceae bacterium]